MACNKLEFRKTKSGLTYKIIPGNGKDSVKIGNWLKLNVIQKLNDDSVLQTSYGKMPAYAQIMAGDKNYGPEEVLSLLKKGDSAIVIMYVDSLLSKKIIPDTTQLPPFLKKGDKITISLRVVEVFTNDSLFQTDRDAEMKKDMPRQMEEQKEQMAKRTKDMKDQQSREFAALEQSGEAPAQRKIVEDYLKAKNINAKKVGDGVYVEVIEPGTGAQAAEFKYVTIKYSGRRLVTPDVVFESNTYPGLQLGTFGVVAGWDQGLLSFKEGGKGRLFLPAYMGYGKNPRPGGPIQSNDALIFDVEMVKVSDNPEVGPPMN